MALTPTRHLSSGAPCAATNLANAGVFDYEMRFTQECVDGMDGNVELSDCLAYRRFGDGKVMEMPFSIVANGYCHAR